MNEWKRILSLTLCLLMILALPLSAQAETTTPKSVRVGWFESSYCYRDAFGRRCGIDYEYRHRIAAYTGWSYEYVEDSWPNLLQMLIDGEIDMLCDVSYTEERSAQMLFPELPMGAESYYLYIDADNREISSEDLSTLDGRRVGVNRGSVQEGFLRDWAERNRLRISIVPMTADEDASIDMLESGELDGYVGIDTIGARERVVPVVRVGSSDYYYAVSRSRPDLLSELNTALAAIQEEEPYFNQRLSEEHLYTTQTNAFLAPGQQDWLNAHGTIRVGYRDNYLPFCARDKATGELSGALRDYLDHAAHCLKNAELRFEAVPYASTDAALAAMRAGEVDCVFPLCLSSYEADEQGIRLTNPAMKSEMHAVLRASDPLGISPERAAVFAVNTGDANVVSYIRDNYPLSQMAFYAGVNACFDAIAAGDADCALVSSYRVHELEERMERFRLYSVPTGETLSLSFAVSGESRELYFILNKTVLLTKSQDMDTALAANMRAGQKMTALQFLRENWVGVLLLMAAVFGVIVFLLIQKLKAERTASEQRRLLEQTAEIAGLKDTIASLLDNMPGINYTKDAETGVYLACNQAFAEYAHRQTPDSVVGLSDAELFDAATAARLAEDDRMALSMDGPYVFFEEMPDAAGNPRTVKTTKLKYTDAGGRLCVLGMSQDASDAFRLSRGSVTDRESYEKALSSGLIYTHIAQALAQGYAELYYVDLYTEQFMEYRIDEAGGSLSEARRGWHFFESCQEEIEQRVYAEDRDAVRRALERKTLVAALDQSGTFILTYRLNGEQRPRYVTMKVTRMQDDRRTVIMGVMDVDDQMQQRRAAARLQEEQIAYNRLSALSGSYLCVYVVIPETSRYRELSTSAGFESFSRPREGMDFFADSREQSRIVLHPEDRKRFLLALTRENVLTEVERSGIFTLSYRLMIEGLPRYVQMKAVMVDEKEGRRLIVGINDIDAQVRQEEQYVKHLAQAQIEAHVDALTGVKNRHAYLMAEERLNDQIADRRAPEFAVVILDVNDLKLVNDREGHAAGDQYLRDACRIVCRTFKHSPVFRIGGDEFAVIAQGDDYARMEELTGLMDRQNAEAQEKGGIVIAYGMARYEGDESVAPVFERADHRMYANKSALKERKSSLPQRS